MPWPKNRCQQATSMRLPQLAPTTAHAELHRDGTQGKIDTALRTRGNSLYNILMNHSARIITGWSIILAFGLCGCSDPDEAGNEPAELPHPTAPVEVIIDDMGIAHVYAESDEDAFFGAGYAMAKERLFQMELFRRQAHGTRAELLGADFIPEDVGARTFNFVKLGKADEGRVRAENPEHAKILDAWIAGINRRIGEITKGIVPRPYGLRETEFNFVPEPWEAFEGYAVGKLLSFGMSNNLDHDILATVRH
jgi:penicillin G amidase